MPTGPEYPRENSGEAAAPVGAALGGEAGTAQSEAVLPESAAVSPPPPVPELPAALVRLKAYCDERGLKTTTELDPPFITAEFPNGRSKRTVFIGSEESAEILMAHPLEEIVFLEEYSAICSYKGHWIEAAVRALGPPRGSLAGAIFGGARGNEPLEIEMPGNGGVTLRLTDKRGLLYWLDYGAKVYLRIEGMTITEHDKAVNLLEDMSNSLFMQIDFRFDSPLSLARDRLVSLRFSRPRGQLDEDDQLTYPRFLYEKSPSSLYWYARSATSMPLLQFLAFYQCIEFFFPQFSRQETIAKIKNILKDPAFDGAKDSSINVILNATLEGRRGSLIEEKKQLRATLEHCVDGTALRDFLNATEERKRYYGNECKKISDKKISLSDDTVIVEQTSERIYDVRCKIVHTKNMEGAEIDEMILPFSKEADLLMDDVELIQFLARRVLIASSSPLRV